MDREEYKLMVVTSFLELMEQLGTDCIMSLSGMLDSGQDIPENPCQIIQDELNRLNELYEARINKEKSQEEFDDSNVHYLGGSDDE